MPQDDAGNEQVTLGLDIGTNSVGWALTGTKADGSGRLIALGSRVFPAGVDGDIQSGRDNSRAGGRRLARQLRRMTRRRARRISSVARLLEERGLLPVLGTTPRSRHDVLADLDARLCALYPDHGAGLPYFLRSRALDAALSPHELGRAILHLAQRRGFLSNRRTPDTSEDGLVKTKISELDKLTADSGARTIGEYFSMLDPHESRIRQRYTSRAQYRHELDAILSAQVPHHEVLTPRFIKKLRSRIFHQRPLKSVRKLIGRCSLEPQARRCAFALPIAQEFRLLQKLNDLRAITGDGEIRALLDHEREIIIDLAGKQAAVTFTAIKRAINKEKLTVSPIREFNLESGGEDKLKGLSTTGRLQEAAPVLMTRLCDRPDEIEALVHLLRSVENSDRLANLVARRFDAIPAEAMALTLVHFEEGYAAFSRRALGRIVPRLREGASLQTVLKEEYGVVELFPAEPTLRPMRSLLREVRNPAVERSLSEMRKVVNGIVREYGKPDRIHLELGSDLKRPRKERERIYRRNRNRQKEREAQVPVWESQVIARGYAVGDPSRTDLEKLLLLEECNGLCPYTGRQITAQDLFGPNPSVEVEHIIPYALSLDDSFANKTLCVTAENRIKNRRTPYEAYSNTERWHDILHRVRAFKGDAARRKLELFQLEEVGMDFLARHLNDTRYASLLAKRYVERLFGRSGGGEHPQILAATGVVTATMRRSWNLEGLLGGLGKTRNDHRHHAVDAAVLALTTPEQLSGLRAVIRTQGARPGRTVTLDQPWPGFREELQDMLESIVVSNRPDRRIGGPLHEDTNYARRHGDDGKPVTRVRKTLASMSSNEIERIADPVVCRVVSEALGGRDPRKVFQDDSSLPRMPAKNGLGPVIRSARITSGERPFAIGGDEGRRFVLNKQNHHAVVYERVKDGRWEWEIVSRFEAHRRRRANEPVVLRHVGPERRFVFSVVPGDCLEVTIGDDGRRDVVVVTAIANGDIECRMHHDARKKSERKRIRFNSGRALKHASPQKIDVSPIGKVRGKND